ncbi:MAG: penicillin-binding protein 2 [Candidatus Omnitrophica bacterium]|nr:penicillin-binding protein 2 [Candidatus Omnitrophota bacterium]
MRFKIFYISILIAFISVASRLFFLQIIQGNYYRLQSARNTIRVIPEKAIRGKILDRNGVILAQDRLALDVAIIPQDLKDMRTVFSELSKIFAIKEEELEARFRGNISTPFAPVVVLGDIDKEKALIVAEKTNKFPGVIIESRPTRVYPYKYVASHILGYMGMPEVVKESLGDYGFTAVNQVGISGIEKYLERFLRGENGGMQIEVDNRGRQTSLLGLRVPKKGVDIRLTIDIRVQEILDDLFSENKGAAILIHPFNGEILAMVSSPAFDPNVFVEKEHNKLRLRYLLDKDASLFNRATLGQYPAGSVFKIITALAALTNNAINTDTRFFCPGGKLIGRREFKCWSRHGEEDLKDAIVHSCNVYFYNAAILLGAQRLSEYAKIFNLGRPTGIDLPMEESGFVPSPSLRREIYHQGWYKGDTANLAIGQGGLLVTPIQIASMISVIANSGQLLKPHLVAEVGGKKVIYEAPSKVNIESNYLSFLRGALRSVVEDSSGTAHMLQMYDMEISAKTGTAQAGAGRKHGWVVGFLPFDKPEVAFVIFLEDSQGSSSANALAIKLFRRLYKEKLLVFKQDK